MKSFFTFLLAITIMAILNILEANGCTRIVYKGADSLYVTARTMDWEDNLDTHIWIFPRGIKRSGCAGANSVNWTSQYGSVVTSGYDIATTDGMNEVGLVANLFWLDESEFPRISDKIPGLSVTIWVQYILDNFATVQEAVEAFKDNKIQVSTNVFPGTSLPVNIHISVSDALGDNAIFEYVNKKLIIHHNPSYTVLANSPIYEEQLAINKYWKFKKEGMLPGTSSSSDRFVRAAHYIDLIPKNVDQDIAIAGVVSLIRYLSVPYRVNTPQTSFSSTQWRSVADQKNKVYYFESVLWPGMIWLRFEDINFSESEDIKKIDLALGKVYAGNVTNSGVKSEPFVFYNAR